MRLRRLAHCSKPAEKIASVTYLGSEMKTSSACLLSSTCHELPEKSIQKIENGEKENAKRDQKATCSEKHASNVTKRRV